MVSVTTEVVFCEAGQSVTVAGHCVTVWTEVVKTVEVVNPAPADSELELEPEPEPEVEVEVVLELEPTLGRVVIVGVEADAEPEMWVEVEASPEVDVVVPTTVAVRVSER